MKELAQNIHATGDESLGELVSLWRSGHTGGYSREFLAGTICGDLGRLRRLVSARTDEGVTPKAEEDTQLREAEVLVAQDSSFAAAALAGIDSQGSLDRLKVFVRSFQRKSKEDCAEEGFDLLCDYDAFHLILQVLAQRRLSAPSRLSLRQHERRYRQMTRTIEANLLAFYPAALMINSYCLAWNVEEDSVLSQVARLGSREMEMLWVELNRTPGPLPEATPECPDENQVALAFEGQLSASEQGTFDHHLKGCGYCRGLLDVLTATFVRLPDKLPPAPREALPRELRRPDIKKVLLARLRQAYERVRVFFVSPFLPQPSLVRGTAASAPPLRFDEILQREVLIESPDVQAVAFLRGNTLYLSILVDRPKAVQSLLITDMQTQSAWREEKRTEERGEILLHLGPAAALCGKQLEISFRVGKRLYRTQVHIRDQAEGQA
jgi:hypothetical protein